MRLIFDPAKNASNIDKHGVSLADAEKLEWDVLLVTPDTRHDYGELRYIGYSFIGDRLYCVVYTDRADSRRVISLRKANKREVNYLHITTKSGKEIYIPTDKEDTEINRGIVADDDTYELSEFAFSQLQPVKVGRPKAEITKTPISIRLSAEVVDYFRSTGKGWQTRIDNALREYIESHPT